VGVGARENKNMIPGEYLLSSEPVEINAGRTTARIEVTNRGDRPVQVGSHCHFFEVNRWLSFDRARAYGMRLNIAAGTAVRFEPGDTRAVELVALGGARRVSGLNGLTEGALDDPAVRERALERVDDFVRSSSAKDAKTSSKVKPERP
jgi:urease subunit beta